MSGPLRTCQDKETYDMLMNNIADGVGEIGNGRD